MEKPCRDLDHAQPPGITDAALYDAQPWITDLDHAQRHGYTTFYDASLRRITRNPTRRNLVWAQCSAEGLYGTVSWPYKVYGLLAIEGCPGRLPVIQIATCTLRSLVSGVSGVSAGAAGAAPRHAARRLAGPCRSAQAKQGPHCKWSSEWSFHALRKRGNEFEDDGLNKMEGRGIIWLPLCSNQINLNLRFKSVYGDAAS